MENIIKFLVELGQNIALLLSLTFLYSLFVKKASHLPLKLRSALLGLIFGIVALVGMTTPLTIAPGIIVDGRVVLVGLAGTLGGSISALVAAFPICIYRIVLGGVGTGPGVGAVLTAMAMGCLAHRYLVKDDREFKPKVLLALGFAFAIEGLLWTLALPREFAWQAFKAYAIPVLICYPLGSLFVGTLFLKERDRLKIEEALRENDRIKTEFVKTVAHEFRTPLTAIQGFSELLLNPVKLSKKEQEESLRYIHERSLHLSEMVDDILNIARIESGASISLKLCSCSISDIFRQVAPFLKTLASKNRIIINLVEDKTLVNVDQNKMGQVLENLLSNACKFSDPESTIQLVGGVVAGYYQITVIDQGIGMTSEQVRKVFDKFYRVDSSDTAIAGVGLGMSIVKHIVEKHGGKIWIKSELGQGTTVNFTIPL